MNDIESTIYNDLEEVLKEKIRSYGLNDLDAKHNANLILDYGYDGVHDLALELTNIMDNENAD
tara:strand:- start:271 stop:459 length:189 start_codon:yes stop_codon:yes gene_type:complete